MAKDPASFFNDDRSGRALIIGFGLLAAGCAAPYQAAPGVATAKAVVTHPIAAISFSRAIHRFDSANSVVICAVFFAGPR